MDRLPQIAHEIIPLSREELYFLVLGRTSNLKDADLLQYHSSTNCGENWKGVPGQRSKTWGIRLKEILD
jgi:hypothetical protein